MSFNESFVCVRNAGLDPYMAMNLMLVEKMVFSKKKS